MGKKFHINKTVCIGLVLVQWLSCSWIVPARDIEFDQIKMIDGLPDNSVRGIIQDSKGYLWFATLNGLSRYDGKNFRNYHAIPGDTSSLSNNRIGQLKEDMNGYIWGITNEGNVHRFDPSTNIVTDLFSQILKKEVPIFDYIITSKGDLWLWGSYGCVNLKYSTDREVLQAEHLSKEQYLPDNKVYFIQEDKNGKIWIGTGAGLVRIDNSALNTRIINTHFDGQCIISVYEDENHLWFGTRNSGLKCYDQTRRNFRNYPEINEQLKTNPIHCIQPVDSTRILLGSRKYVFDVDLQETNVLRNSHYSIDSVRRIFVDSRDNIWISHYARGICRYDQNSRNLLYYSLGAETRDFLGEGDFPVWLEDSNNDFWIGVRGGGLFLYRPESDDFENFRYSEEKVNSLSSDKILYLFEDNSKNLWIGTMWGGISKVDLSPTRFFWHQPISSPENVYDNEIRAATIDKNGLLWLGSIGGKVFCYDNNKKLLRTIPDDLVSPSRKLLVNINVYCLYFDDSGNLWIGSKGKGIFVLKDIANNPGDDIDIVHFDQNFYVKDQPALSQVVSIVQDVYGQYWIGSHLSGVALLRDPFENPSFDLFTEENDHLASKQSRYLFIDNSENLWIGSSGGISFLKSSQLQSEEKEFLTIKNDRNDPLSLGYNSVDYIFQSDEGTIYAATMGGGFSRLTTANLDKGSWQWENFNESDGLSSNKVYAIKEDFHGDLWISTSSGVNRFNPVTGSFENFFVEKSTVLNYFTESCAALTNKGEIVFGNSIGFLSFNPLTIGKDSSRYPIVLSKFRVNGNEVFPQKSGLLNKSIEYSSQVDLSYVENSFQFDFSVLDYKDPDKLQFSFKLENYDDDWSTPLTTSTALYQNMDPGDYNFLLTATNSHGVRMPEVLRFGITIHPQFLKSPIGILLIILASGSLILLIFFLYQKQLEAKHKIVYRDRLNEKKLQYYTNISHEFKTPLTMIINPVKDIIADIETPEILKDSAKQIHKNAVYLLNLVEQILDFRKIREEQMQLSISHIDIVDYVRNIFEVFVPLSMKKNIDFRFKTSKDVINGYIDCQVINKILNNLLSNAFKFTPEGKSIEISMDCDARSEYLELSVKDEGRGIKKGELGRIFERFHRSENSSGLGLFFVKELVTLHQGTIDATSEFKRGSHFRISLPISKELMDSTILSHEQTDRNKLKIPPIVETFSEQVEESTLADSKTSLLIIEDNEDMRQYLDEKFKRYYITSTASNGQEGLEVALKKPPDFIVCDLMMPVMDGLETIRNLRENFITSHIPVILLTANSSEEKEIEGLESGAIDYITKPFDFKLLKLKIDNYVSKRKKLVHKFSKDPDLPVDIITKSDQDKKFIEKVTQIIEEDIGEPNFNIENLSKKVGCGRTNFYNKMKGITGETPHEYILSIQMKKAALLLKETDYPIADIGIMAGFYDANYFSKSFKKYFGKAPKAYQVELRESV